MVWRDCMHLTASDPLENISGMKLDVTRLSPRPRTTYFEEFSFLKRYLGKNVIRAHHFSMEGTHSSLCLPTLKQEEN